MNFDSNQQSERFLVSTKVRSEKYGAGTKANLKMLNLSSSGARLELLKSTDFVKKGEILKLIVELDEVQSRRVLNAEVIWTKGIEFGVNFIKSEEVLGKLFQASLKYPAAK